MKLKYSFTCDAANVAKKMGELNIQLQNLGANIMSDLANVNFPKAGTCEFNLTIDKCVWQVKNTQHGSEFVHKPASHNYKINQCQIC